MKKNSPYSYIENLKSLYIPRTPSAALQAAIEGILPIEAFIYKSTGLNPIMKKPYNLDDIEWLLSRSDRDLQTNLLLREVLTEISQYKDKEVALFAAESLNAMEKEYNSRLVALKEKIAATADRDNQSAAAKIYYHLALLNKGEKTLCNFYLKEGYLLLGDLENRDEARDEDRYLLIRILIHLKLYDQAEQLLPDTKASRLIRMELAFEKRNISKLTSLIEELKQDKDLTEMELETIRFWSGKNE
ncbi:MAG: hypothetical protein B6241_07620 [Spirochaetaceae bacterium 4572_59]|nr:MAG: hypothetical protein B6241_07620 [Spirochaetaceae bacterium 4572_59]